MRTGSKSSDTCNQMNCGSNEGSDAVGDGSEGSGNNARGGNDGSGAEGSGGGDGDGDDIGDGGGDEANDGFSESGGDGCEDEGGAEDSSGEGNSKARWVANDGANNLGTFLQTNKELVIDSNRAAPDSVCPSVYRLYSTLALGLCEP